MLPNTINFRGAIYVVAEDKPERAVPGNRSMKQTVKHYTDPRVKNYPNLNKNRVNPGLVKLKQERNELQKYVDLQKARYDKVFAEYNKFADALEKLPTATTTTPKTVWETRIKSRLDGLDQDIDRIEKDIDANMARIAELDAQLEAAKAARTPQTPISVREEPMFKAPKPTASELSAEKIERDQALISKLQAAKLKPEWADKPGDLERMDRMIAEAQARLRDLAGDTVNPDLYGNARSQ